MDLWHDIETSENTVEESVNVIIEIPQGSSAKFEYDKKYGIMKLDRVLYTATHYPANYGFIPKTLADDNDPLDILVLCKEKMIPGMLMTARIIGVFVMVDGEDIDEKILAVAKNDPTFRQIKNVKQLPDHIVEEMTHFFEVYKELEGKKTKVMKFKDREDAVKIVHKCQAVYSEKFKK